MTRANINYIYQNSGEAPRTLFFYWNGDQYPTGIRDSYNVLDFVENTDMSPEAFKIWALDNYEGITIDDLGEGGQPKVFYTDGFITDYSYVFEKDNIRVWNWDELEFKGTPKEFAKWLKKQK